MERITTMLKGLFAGSALLLTLALNAQVTPPAGAVEPVASTADSPVWYNIMSSHMTAADRQNRYMTWEGNTTYIPTTKFDSGITTTAAQEDKHLFRLEAAETEGEYYLVSKLDGKRITASASTTSNTPLTMTDDGVPFALALSSSTGQSQTASMQYCLNYTGSNSTAAYINAMDQNTPASGDAAGKYALTVYSAGTHQASGWFFYQVDVVEATYAFNFSAATGGAIAVTNDGAAINSGDVFQEGTVLNVTITPDANYEIDEVLLNESALTPDDLASFTYTTIGEAMTLRVTFKMTTGLKNQKENTLLLFPSVFDTHLTVSGDSGVCTVINLTGSTVYTTQVNGEKTINLSTLSSGIYLVRFVNESGKSVVRRVIKK